MLTMQDGILGVSVYDERVVDLDADPLVPTGWKVEEHVKGGQFEWDPAKVALYLSEGQRNGKWIQGTQLRQELKAKNPYNANLLDYLLAHPELIPEEWEERKSEIPVSFWGTIYRDPDGNLRVRYLHWSGGRWDWGFGWLDGDWSGPYPVAVPASA